MRMLKTVTGPGESGMVLAQAARLLPPGSARSPGRSMWPEVKIIVRGDSGFCRDELMDWGEANGWSTCWGCRARSGRGPRRRRFRRGLLKIDAQVKVSLRRVPLSLASGYPYEEAFAAEDAELQPLFRPPQPFAQQLVRNAG